MAIKLLISDFDGTLVDTFEANYRAYRDAFGLHDIHLSRERYRECFGLRFDNFMERMEISDVDIRENIRETKAARYPMHFDCLNVNRPLLELIRAFHRGGGKTAIASTARGRNLRNALKHIGATEDFDIILAGESVAHGKPNPEIYEKVIDMACVNADEALIFEDSSVGFEAAKAAGINYLPICKSFF